MKKRMDFICDAFKQTNRLDLNKLYEKYKKIYIEKIQSEKKPINIVNHSESSDIMIYSKWCIHCMWLQYVYQKYLSQNSLCKLTIFFFKSVFSDGIIKIIKIIKIKVSFVAFGINFKLVKLAAEVIVKPLLQIVYFL